VQLISTVSRHTQASEATALCTLVRTMEYELNEEDKIYIVY